MKHFLIKPLIFGALIAAVALGNKYFYWSFFRQFFQNEPPVAEQLTISRDEEIQAILESLSARERVWQLMDILAFPTDPPEFLAARIEWIVNNNPGFITVYGDNLSLVEVSEFTQMIRSRFDTSTYMPMIVADHEGGMVQRLGGAGFLVLPNWRQMCQASREERKALFTQSAVELRQAGIHIVLAPVLDVARVGSVIDLEYRACRTSDEAIETASDFIISFSQNGILPVAKHFPGIGAVDIDLHTQSDSIILESQDTVPFEQIFEMFPNIGVMTTHVVEEKTNGVPCSLSEVCLDEFLIRFPQTIVFVDAIEMASAGLNDDVEVRTLQERIVQTLAAGNDIVTIMTRDMEKVEIMVDAVEEEYNSNEIFRRQIDASVKKVLNLKVSQKTE